MLLTIQQYADMIKVDSSQVRRAISKGRIKALSFSDAVKIDASLKKKCRYVDSNTMWLPFRGRWEPQNTVLYGKRCGFSKRYFLVLVACRHLTCTKTECRKMFLSLIAPLTTIRLNRGKRSNRLPYIFAQGQER